MKCPYWRFGLVVMVLHQFVTAADLEWSSFQNSKMVFLTDPFSKSIAELPESQKAEAIDRVNQALESPEIEIRRRAALTLGALGDMRGVPVMIADMSKVTGQDRDNVAVALRVLKDPKAIPVLRQALADKSPYVRSIALAALGEMKASEAYSDIVAHTKDKEREGGCIPSSPARLACYALGALGDLRAIPILIDLLHEEDLQGSAVQSLEVLTKQKFGSDSNKWTEWWKSQKQ